MRCYVYGLRRRHRVSLCKLTLVCMLTIATLVTIYTHNIYPSAVMGSHDTLLFTFGAIADLQYGDLDNKMNFEQTHWRYYRQSLDRLREAVTAWKNHKTKVSFVIQLGDLIDGFNAPKNESQSALTLILDEFKALPGPVYHTWGNHEFYNFKRAELLQGPLNSASLASVPSPDYPQNDPKPAYYSFSPHPHYVFVMLDTYEYAVIGREKDDPVYVESLKWIRSKNSNEQLNCPDGLDDVERRFCAFNGGLGQGQLDWLRHVLDEAQGHGSSVIVAGHQAMHPQASWPLCLCWNYEDVLSLLQSHPCVLAYFAGHDHRGGYHLDDAGIHHLTFPGVIESLPGTNDFATISVYDDRLEVKGQGNVPDLVIKNRNV